MDTSAWVDYLDGQSTPAAEALETILSGSEDVCTCGIVVSEVFQGFRREAGRNRLAELFREMRFLEPSGIDLYFKAARLYRQLRQRGVTIRSTIDCLVAVIAEDAGCYVLARDRDMDRILESGLVGTRAWPG